MPNLSVLAVNSASPSLRHAKSKACVHCSSLGLAWPVAEPIVTTTNNIPTAATRMARNMRGPFREEKMGRGIERTSANQLTITRIHRRHELRDLRVIQIRAPKCAWHRH